MKHLGLCTDRQHNRAGAMVTTMSVVLTEQLTTFCSEHNYLLPSFLHYTKALSQRKTMS